MRYQDAYNRVLVAGRELGGGAMRAVDRLCPGLAEAKAEGFIAEARRVREDTDRRIADRADDPEARAKFEAIRGRLGEVDEDGLRARASWFALGVAVGRVQAEEPEALAVLDAIYEEWRRNS